MSHINPSALSSYDENSVFLQLFISMHMIKFRIVHHVTIIKNFNKFHFGPERVTRCRCKFCNHFFSPFYDICLILMEFDSHSSFQVTRQSLHTEPNWSAIFCCYTKDVCSIVTKKPFTMWCLVFESLGYRIY